MSSGVILGPDTTRLGHTPARLEVRTLGTFQVRVGQRPIELTGRKARALIGYLALTESRRETRDRLVGLLWSETDEGRARASLRQTVYEIREAFQRVGGEGVAADRLTVALAELDWHADLVDVVEEAKAGRAHALLLDSERPIDGLFVDLEAVDPAFNVWLLAKRQTYADRITGYLQDAMRRGCEDIERVARALLNLDPTNEEAARALIRARVAVGDTGGALGIYKTLWDLLESDYDTEPSKETQDLIAEVKLGGAGTVQPATPEVSPAAFGRAPIRLVVALGGFDTSGTSEKNRYLIHGFRQELIVSLVRFREWIVRDQAGVEAGATRSGADIGEYVIDASAFEGARGLRLLIMLRDAKTNNYLWSERIELSIENWFDAQQAVVQRLATSLNVYVSAGQLKSATYEQKLELPVFDLWLKSQILMNTFDKNSWREARSLMFEVIRQAPAFSPAYSSLSQLNNSAHIAIPGIFLDRPTNTQSLAFARQAAQLDPIDSRAQLCLGWANILASQFNQGRVHHDLAVDLNENDAWILLSSGLGAAFRAEHETAKLRSERALELIVEPIAAFWGFRCQIAFLSSDYEAAVSFGERSESILHFLGWKAAALGMLGDSSAQEHLQRYLDAALARWEGKDSAHPRSAMRWFLHCFPIERRADWERLRDGLAAAGGPTDGLEFENSSLSGIFKYTS